MKSSRERDESVDRLLRQTRRTPPETDTTPSCLDAETVAAWVDGALSGAALNAAQSHVADCVRCQSLLGTLARISHAIPPRVAASSKRAWLSWLVPLATAAAVLMIWVAVQRDAGPRVSPTREFPSKPAAAETMPSASTLPVDRPRNEVAAKQPQSATASRGDTPPKTALLAEAEKRAGNIQPSAQTTDLRKDAERREADTPRPPSGATDRLSPSASAAAAPAAPAAAAAAASPTTKAQAVARSAEQATERGDIEIVSPAPLVRWLLTGTRIDRSTDGGASWETLSSGNAAELTAGAAPSESVCWVVGRGGVVLLSTDGRAWRRVPFPEATDLSAIRAADARRASVTTTDGRTFSTTDGGATWAR